MIGTQPLNIAIINNMLY